MLKLRVSVVYPGPRGREQPNLGGVISESSLRDCNTFLTRQYCPQPAAGGHCPELQKRRLSGVVSMDSPRGNHA